MAGVLFTKDGLEIPWVAPCCLLSEVLDVTRNSRNGPVKV